jgi:hypothetical protein
MPRARNARGESGGSPGPARWEVGPADFGLHAAELRIEFPADWGQPQTPLQPSREARSRPTAGAENQGMKDEARRMNGRATPTPHVALTRDPGLRCRTWLYT